MPELARRRPLGDLPRMIDEMDRLFETFFGRPGPALAGEGRWHPAVDVHLTPESVIVRADLPGVDPKKVEVSVEENTLTIKGERLTCAEAAKDEECWFNETARGRFHKVVDLPDYVDGEKASASYQNGVLAITMPRRAPVKRKVIEITE